MATLKVERMTPTRRMRTALDILGAGLAAADPAGIMHRYIRDDAIILEGCSINPAKYRGIYTVAFGKAAYSMSRAVGRILPVRRGIIVVPHGYKPSALSRRFQLHLAGHPRPDHNSVVAAKTVIKFLEARRREDLVLFLVSGGASSLLSLPDGITLSDKMHVTHRLLRCGAGISEINCVRKHISGIKGGRLLDGMSCQGASLIMSDVEGDDPATIASGTTYMDPTTFEDALEVIKRHQLSGKVPDSVIGRLQAGAAGRIPETPKGQSIPYKIVANNDICLDAMAGRAQDMGYPTETSRYFCDISETAERIMQEAPSGGCLVFGGEPTVRVVGKGRGGRSQELVLRLLRGLRPGQVAAAMGTDGIDGNTAAAGAVCQGPPDGAARMEPYLERNDSHSYFERYGGLIRTGPTHTNLLDIGVVLG